MWSQPSVLNLYPSLFSKKASEFFELEEDEVLHRYAFFHCTGLDTQQGPYGDTDVMWLREESVLGSRAGRGAIAKTVGLNPCKGSQTMQCQARGDSSVSQNLCPGALCALEF